MVLAMLSLRAAGQVESMIDIGCGWGEWIPAALQQGVGDGRLPESFRYLGVDIAWQPIKHLKEVHKNSFAPKLEFDVLDGVQDELPKGYQVALVRYVPWQMQQKGKGMLAIASKIDQPCHAANSLCQFQDLNTCWLYILNHYINHSCHTNCTQPFTLADCDRLQDLVAAEVFQHLNLRDASSSDS